jgi:hypothetical protein
MPAVEDNGESDLNWYTDTLFNVLERGSGHLWMCPVCKKDDLKKNELLIIINRVMCQPLDLIKSLLN